MLKKTVSQKPETGSPNQINAGTRMEGVIHCEGNIRIDGHLKGQVHAQGKVVIGPGGKVEGEITCANADIMGELIGNISVREQTIVKSTGVLQGDLTTGTLGIEEGAKLNGNCRMQIHDA